VGTLKQTKAIALQSTISLNPVFEMGNAGEGLPRSVILRGRREFQRIRESGKKVRVGEFLLFFLPQTEAKFAVTVPKRIGNAVQRNYARRRIREYYRRNRALFSSMTILFHLTRLPENWDDLFAKVSTWANRLRRGPVDSSV